MEFIRTSIENKGLIWQLGKNDFKNRFANTSLGSLWGFLQPFVFMITYVIVFQYILRVGSSGEYPFVVWFLPGMSMWLCINDSVTNASGSIRAYCYLVKKVVFPVDIIPLITIVASAFVSLFLFLITIIICAIFGYVLNVLLLAYAIFAAYCFLIGFTRFTAALTTLVPDFSQLLGIIMQLLFWFTPVVWNMNMLDGQPIIQQIMYCMPFTYLVTVSRQVFIEGSILTESYGLYTIVFWLVTILMFLWGNSVFKRGKKDFADIL